MRVLMSLPDRRARGGPPSHLYLLHDELIGLGVDVRSFPFGGRTHDEGALRKIAGRLGDLLAFPARIIRHRPDIVHLNTAFDPKSILRDMLFVPLARIMGRKVVIKLHGSDVETVQNRRPFWRVATWLVANGASLVCVLSQEEKAYLQARFPRANLVCVKNALDFKRYRKTFDFRQRYHIPADKPMLLFIGRFIATKGLRETLQAMPAIRQVHDVHAVFVGDGPVKAESEALAASLALSDCTTFTGYIDEDDTVNAYLAADMLVFPTYHQEGMPMVIFHSLACGLPIITTRMRAAADWLEEGTHALFVPPREPQPVANAVLRLLDDRTLRQSMGEAGRELARRFDKTAVAREFLALYNALLARTAVQPAGEGTGA